VRWALLLALSGCDYVLHIDEVHAPSDAHDASSPRDIAAEPDAPLSCGMFAGTPVNFIELDGLVTGDPAIDRTELELYMTVGTSPYGIAVSHRTATNMKWTQPSLLAGITSGTGNDQDPSITGDGAHLVFISDRSGTGEHAYEATRITGDAWSTPVPLSGLASTVMTSITISWDGRTIYYTDNAGDLNSATRAQVGMPFTLLGTVLAGPAQYPTVSLDQKELYIDGSAGGIDRAIRGDSGAQFDMRAMATQFGDGASLSYDGRTLYLHDAADGSVMILQRSCQ
jgi:WD40-like Beta Propeller Repeat